LHIFRLKSASHFRDYLDVLKIALKQGFNLTIRDYHGRSIPERLHELMDDWDIDSEYLREVSRILDVDASICDNSGGVLKTTPVIELFGNLEAATSVDSQHSRKGLVTVKKYTIRFSKLKEALGKHKTKDPTSPKSDDLTMDTLDDNSDTQLILILRQWPQNSLSRAEFEEVVKKADIHMRDQRGYTALAIAACCGLREAVSTLLKHGANLNTRSYHKTSVLAHAAAYLARAQKEHNDPLYAQILSCIVLLTDYGAKAVVTVYDEYTTLEEVVPTQSGPKAKKRKPPRSTSSQIVLSTPLNIIQEDSYEMPEECIIAELEGDTPLPEHQSTWDPEPARCPEFSAESQFLPFSESPKPTVLKHPDLINKPLNLKKWSQRDLASVYGSPLLRTTASSQAKNSAISPPKLMESSLYSSRPVFRGQKVYAVDTLSGIHSGSATFLLSENDFIISRLETCCELDGSHQCEIISRPETCCEMDGSQPLYYALPIPYYSRYSPQIYFGTRGSNELVLPKIIVTEHFDDEREGSRQNITEDSPAQKYSDGLSEYFRQIASPSINSMSDFDAPRQANWLPILNPNILDLYTLSRPLFEQPESLGTSFWEFDEPESMDISPMAFKESVLFGISLSLVTSSPPLSSSGISP
jgi:hypothetical protein